MFGAVKTSWHGVLPDFPKRGQPAFSEERFLATSWVVHMTRI